MGGTHNLEDMSQLLRDLNWQGKWADISHGNQQKTHARYGKWKITASCNSPVCGLTAHKSALQEGTRRVQRTIWTWVKKRTPEELNARAYQATPEHITFFVPPFFIAGLMLLWPKNHWQHYYVLEVSKGGGSTTRTAGPYRPHQVMLSNESWVEGGGRGGRHSGLWHSSSQAATSHPETLLSRNSWTFQEQLDIHLPLGSSARVSLFALLEHEAFVFPFKLSWSQSTSVLSFLLFFSSSHRRGEWARCCVLTLLLAEVSLPQVPFHWNYSRIFLSAFLTSSIGFKKHVIML